MSSKSERIKTLRALADECWAESEPSVARDTLDCLEVSLSSDCCIVFSLLVGFCNVRLACLRECHSCLVLCLEGRFRDDL